MDTKDTFLEPKNANLFCCDLCDFKCSKKYNFEKHLDTRKHSKRYKKIQNDTNLETKNANTFSCECGKEFSYHSGLWRHKQKCQPKPTDISDYDGLDDKALIIKLLQQNQELQKSLIELSKEKTITTHTNSHNKTFNLQLFLNETCKDALNISEFVSSIKPQLTDLENTGRLGYVDGISKIILNKLKLLNTHDRPIHCTDIKREIIYIKDNNEWTKEDDNKNVLTKAIKIIANENIKQISNWTKEYPDCTQHDSRKNDFYLQIVSNSMSGSTKDETNKNISKIISNIAKEVTIDKRFL